MKRSIKKTVQYLRRFIGKEIIRTKPARFHFKDPKGLVKKMDLFLACLDGFRSTTEDFCYTDEFQILIGFTPDGRMIIRSSRGGSEHTLPIEFTDRNWIPMGRALRARHNTLNEYRGRMIKRIKPIFYTNYVNRSFMDEPVQLISASPYHVIVFETFYCNGSTLILGPQHANPEDWVVVGDWWNFIEGWILF